MKLLLLTFNFLQLLSGFDLRLLFALLSHLLPWKQEKGEEKGREEKGREGKERRVEERDALQLMMPLEGI